jgi:uncharacterized protein YpmS
MSLKYVWKHRYIILLILLLFAILTIFLLIITSKPQEGGFIYQFN